MNTIILRQILILSVFLGAVLGVVTLVPFIGNLAFWILICLSSTAVIVFMTKLELIDLQSIQESAVVGAIIGFVSFIGFSITYIPVIVALAKIFQIYPNYGVSAALSNASFGLILTMVIFMGVLSATVNAFSGFLTYYGIDLYKTLKKNDNNEQFKLR